MHAETRRNSETWNNFWLKDSKPFATDVHGYPRLTIQHPEKQLPGKGWLYAPVAKTVTVPGSALAATDQLSLNLGWTQIGYRGTDGTAPAAGFSCIRGQYDVIVDEADRVYVTGSPFNILKSMQRTKGILFIPPQRRR